MKKKILLKPIKEEPSDYESLEKEIQEVLRREIYVPLMRHLRAQSKLLKNSEDDLLDAIATGRITFYRGKFQGRFSSTLSRALRSIGAEWDRKEGCFLIPQSKLSEAIKHAIVLSESRFQRSVQSIDRELRGYIPADIADKVKIEGILNKSIFKTNKKIESSMKSLIITPKFTDADRSRIAKEYTSNLQLYIQDFATKEIEELRKNIQERVVSGVRYEEVIGDIQRSYGVTQRKAKFLARQETALMTVKLKQIRYESAGVNEYIWKCVAGSPLHPVRPMHKALDGKTCTWNNPPIVDENGNRKNPGQDFGCRCYAIPLVKF